MLKGSIDLVNKGHLVGWLTTDEGNAVTHVDCLVDGEFASSAEGYFRQDLKDLGIGDGSGGVRAWVPASYFDGCVHRVSLVACRHDAILGEVSKELELPRLLPLNPNPWLAITHDRLDGWTPTLGAADGFSFLELLGRGMPNRYSRYTRLSLARPAPAPAQVGLTQHVQLPPRSDSRRVLVIVGKTPTLTPLLVEAYLENEVVAVERVTLGPSWTTYYVSLGKTEEVSELRVWLEASSGVAIVDLALVGVMEWNGKTNAIPPPPDRADEERLELASQVVAPQTWSRGSIFAAPAAGSELADGWWFDSASKLTSTFAARLVTSGTDLGLTSTIKGALAIRHSPLSGPSQVSATIKRGAFLSLPRADIAVELSYSQEGNLVPPRTNIVLLGRLGDSRSTLWCRSVDSPLPGRTATLTAQLSTSEMAAIRAQAVAFPSLEIGIEFRSSYAVTIHQIRVSLPAPPETQKASAAAFEDSGVGQQLAVDTPPQRRSPVSKPKVVMDVVVPVFNATEFVHDNIRSLIRANDGSYRILVVDDASGARTRRLLAEFARAGHITVLSHPLNQGFTRSVNEGVREGAAPYVVTLNSDTTVPRGWHHRLLAPFERFERLGIVGPLSNAGSWQSVPFRFAQNGSWLANSLPLGHDVDGVQEWLGATWEAHYPEIRLLNGFCLCMRRTMLDQVGLFDEVAFPVGYGEENDLCLRAAMAGWELRLVDDLYIYHAKSKSFGKRRSGLSKVGTTRLQEKHPDVEWAEVDAALRHHEGLRAVRDHFRILTGVVE